MLTGIDEQLSEESSWDFSDLRAQIRGGSARLDRA
jgi:hypothetical protein